MKVIEILCCRLIAEKGDIPSSFRCALLRRVCPDPREEGPGPGTLTRDRSRRTVTRNGGDNGDDDDNITQNVIADQIQDCVKPGA